MKVQETLLVHRKFIYLLFRILEPKSHQLFNLQLCSRASDYGLVKLDSTGRIIQFSEKPDGADLTAMVNIEENIEVTLSIL